MADLTGVDPELAMRIQALINASHGRINIQSGYRTHDQQAKLYASEPNLAAAPGHSNHERGLAVDLGGDYALIAQLAPQFGLSLPMSWEPWHVELPGTRKGQNANPAAYTTSPYGDPNPTADPNKDATGPEVLAIAADAMRALTGPVGEQVGPLGEQTGPHGVGVTPTGTSTGTTTSGGSNGEQLSGRGSFIPEQGTGGDKRVPGHTLQQWATDVLTGLGAPVNDINLQTLETWANTESGGYNPNVPGGRYNPLNTTEGALGFSGEGGSQGNIKDYASYDQGVQNQVHNLLHTTGAGYEAVVAALRAGNDPNAVYQAINHSAFGTHFS